MNSPAASPLVALLGVALGGAMLSLPVFADANEARRGITEIPAIEMVGSAHPFEAPETWAMSLDNDMFAAAGQDRDYSGGFSLTVSGGDRKRLGAPARAFHKWLHRKTGIEKRIEGHETEKRQEALQLGLLIFTPIDITASDPESGERPYANLVYASHADFVMNPAQTTMLQSTITLGVIGSGIGEAFQRAIHNATGGERPSGYAHQVADGGELTGRYKISRHSLLSSGRTRRSSYDMKLALEGSIGYLTEAAVGLGLRWGQIGSPWWSSTAEYADYTSQASPASRFTSARERYLTAGIKLRARVYNAFLQGQFRKSDVRFDSADLHRVVAEAWVGLTTAFDGLRVSYVLRHQTAEIEQGIGARGYTWAGVTVSRSFR